MIFHANRRELLHLAQKASKAVPEDLKLELLKGIHLAADADMGMVTLTATNMEVAVRASLAANVEESGQTVIMPHLLLGMLSRLDGETVSVSSLKPTVLQVKAGQAEFAVSVLDGKDYPLPEIPFPEDAVSVSNIKTLAKCTPFTLPRGNGKPSMQCVRLSLHENGLHADACDGSRIFHLLGDKECVGKACILIPASSLQTLAGISEDSDVYEMAITNKTVVFWDGTLFFSARLIEGDFLDTGMVLRQFKPRLTAQIDANTFCNAVGAILPVAKGGTPIEVKLLSGQITLSCESETGSCSHDLPAITTGAASTPFYYNARKLWELLRMLTGSMQLELSERGELRIQTDTVTCYQTPVRAPTAKKKAAVKEAGKKVRQQKAA